MIDSDSRRAIRNLSRQPGLSLTVVLILALGIGANTAVFSVLNSAVLDAAPYPNSKQLFMIRGRDLKRGWDDLDVPAAGFAPIRERTTSFQEIGAWRPATVNLADSDRTPEQVYAARTTSNLFSLCGTSPQMGRPFFAHEGHAASAVVILSDGLWNRRFGADPGILGQPIKVDGGTTRSLFTKQFLRGCGRFPESGPSLPRATRRCSAT